MNLSESCFNDIVSLVEEYINELHITDKALKAYMKKNLKRGLQAGNQFDKETERTGQKFYSKDNPPQDFLPNETDIEWEKRIFPEETEKLTKIATAFRQGMDRYHRARERYNKRHPNNPIQPPANLGRYVQDSARERARKIGTNQVEQLYNGSINHWGWGNHS